MPALLTSSSSMTCPHGGTVSAAPGSTKALAGDPILRASDTCTISGCPFNASGFPSPCTLVQWVVSAMTVKHGGDLVLHEGSVGLCLNPASIPQGTVVIASTQTKCSGL